MGGSLVGEWWGGLGREMGLFCFQKLGAEVAGIAF